MRNVQLGKIQAPLDASFESPYPAYEVNNKNEMVIKSISSPRHKASSRRRHSRRSPKTIASEILNGRKACSYLTTILSNGEMTRLDEEDEAGMIEAMDKCPPILTRSSTKYENI